MEPNTPTPGKTRSLKLTVSFIAFLAVIPLLVFVAFLSLRESQEKEQERLWLLSRSRASIAVSGWFDSAYRHELLAAGVGAGTQAERAVPDDKLRGALAESFADKARDLGLPDAALFWNTGTLKRASLELVSRVGTADATANVDVVAVAQTGEGIRHTGSLGVGASHTRGRCRPRRPPPRRR
ncbi:MAG: hypothetical protein K8T20_13550, partial [Planctomycetes bacterium]|nr:hypothetical protein [Planctomycetota bacterium]